MSAQTEKHCPTCVCENRVHPFFIPFELSHSLFGTWAELHIARLANLKRPKKKGKRKAPYDFTYFDTGVRVEVKAARVVDRNSQERFENRALTFDSEKNFQINFSGIKPDVADVFVFMIVWLDVITYWVIQSEELFLNPPVKLTKHKGAYEIQLYKGAIEKLKDYEVTAEEIEARLIQAPTLAQASVTVAPGETMPLVSPQA